MRGGDPFISSLRQRGELLAAQFVRRARGALADRWRGRDLAVREDEDGIGLAAPSLAGRRQGSRTQLPDADLIWPGR